MIRASSLKVGDLLVERPTMRATGVRRDDVGIVTRLKRGEECVCVTLEWGETILILALSELVVILPEVQSC
jgi:hypothetical protein